MKQVSEILSRLQKRSDIGVTLFDKSIHQNKYVSYKTLHEDALYFAEHLKKLNVKKDEPVVIMLPNNYDFLVAFWGCIYFGAIPTAIYPPMKLGALDLWEQRTRSLCNSLSAQYIVSQDPIYCLGHKGVSHLKLIEIKNIKRDTSLGAPVERGPNDIAFIQFSSGTTGNPRPIIITQKNVLINSKDILDSFTLTKKEKHACASWLPLYHDMGLVGAMICSLRKKGNFYLLRPEVFLANPLLWFEVIHKYRVNFTLAPNFAFDLCQRRIKKEQLLNFDLSCLEVILSGAENVSYQTVNNFIEWFGEAKLNPLSIMPVYGMAEATLGVSFSPHLKGPQFSYFNKNELISNQKAVVDKSGIPLAALGSPIGKMKLKIKNDKGEDQKEGVLGEVCIRGESISPGLYHPRHNIGHFNYGDFMRTGDQGFLHKGELYLWGRIKDLIIINGKNIDAHYIESQLNDLSFIRKGQVMAFGILDDNAIEKLIILCELAKNTSYEHNFTKQVEGIIFKSIGIKPYKIEFYSSGSLPKTSSGKLQRSKAKELWLKSDIKDYKEANRFNLLAKVLKGKWKSVLG